MPSPIPASWVDAVLSGATQPHLAQAIERLLQDGGPVFVRATFLHVCQVCLVRLDFGRSRGVVLVGSGRQPTPRAIPLLGDLGIGWRNSAGIRARWHTKRTYGCAVRPRPARPPPWVQRLLDCPGSHCHLPSITPVDSSIPPREGACCVLGADDQADADNARRPDQSDTDGKPVKVLLRHRRSTDRGGHAAAEKIR